MTEPVLVAIVGAFSLVGVAVVTSILAPIILARLRAIEAQVANDHRHPDGTPINLRDDLDGKHDENTRKLDRVLDISLTTQRDVAWLMQRQAATDDRVDDIEDTLRTKGKTT